MKERILITGGSSLLALNWAQAVFDRCSVTLGLHTRQIVFQGAQTQKINLESVDDLVRVIEKISPKVIIHTAGLTSVDRCESEPELAHHINVILSANVAKASSIAGVRLVHISTDHLFGGEESFADECRPVAPINVYGRTKAEAEYRVLDANPESLVIRTNFYGWGTNYRQSFSDLIIRALRAESNLTLFQDVFYTPILAETLALAVHDLVHLKASGIFNVVGDERISKYEFGKELAEEFDLEFGGVKAGLFLDQITMVGRPRDMSLSNQKVCNFLGRRMGDVKKHLARFHQHETNGFAGKMKTL